MLDWHLCQTDYPLEIKILLLLSNRKVRSQILCSVDDHSINISEKLLSKYLQ